MEVFAEGSLADQFLMTAGGDFLEWRILMYGCGVVPETYALNILRVRCSTSVDRFIMSFNHACCASHTSVAKAR